MWPSPCWLKQIEEPNKSDPARVHTPRTLTYLELFCHAPDNEQLGRLPFSESRLQQRSPKVMVVLSPDQVASSANGEQQNPAKKPGALQYE